MHPRTAAVTALAPLSLAACVARSARGGDNVATLEVRNGYVGPVDVYALREGGYVQRLGNVSTSRTERFRITSALLAGTGTIRIVAVPASEAGRATTGTISVQPGDVVQFNIAVNLSASTVFVR